jgi:hypothetical protein
MNSIFAKNDMANDLCEKCKLIRLPHVADNHTCVVRHHATFDDLISSAESGCQICLYFRPFVEHSRLRRLSLAQPPASDCSSSAVFGRAPEDPFESVPYGPTENFLDGFHTTFGGSEPVKFHVGPGRFYEYVDDREVYNYLGDDDGWEPRHMSEQNALIESDDTTYAEELKRRIERLELSRAVPATRAESEEHEQQSPYEDEFLSRRTETYEEIQWMLSTKGLIDGPEQLWITLTHCSDSCDLNTSAKDDYCVATLTAGSFNIDYFEDDTKICLNGEEYSPYTFASMYPEIWRYNPDLLSIPQKRPKRNLYPRLEFYQHRDATFETIPPIHSREVLLDPRSPAVLELARSWLAKCTANHRFCEVSGEATPVPARLIDVGVHDSDSLRLRIAGEEDQPSSVAPYAALSHCWGSDTGAMTRLMQRSLADMTKGFSMDILAENFKDAVTITRRLHLRYLWIDALCIVQDMPDDWALESAKMDQYYRGAEVTICAVAAGSSQDGILRPRPHAHGQLSIETNAGTLHLRPLLQDSVTVTDAIATSDLRKPVHPQPWNQRAWTLQERLFSRRVLYFTEEQMIWQCRSRFFAEDGQFTWLGKPGGTQIVKRDLVDILDLGPRYVGKERKQASPTIRSTKWYELVQKYTRRQLTFAKDKLPALSGLARQIHTHTKARYVAGLWIGHPSTIITCLMWTPVREDDDRKSVAYPANNGSPSWSWTSLVAEIEHPLDDLDQPRVAREGLDPVFVSAKATPATSDPFGMVKGGKFVLDCWVHAYAGVRTYHEMCKTGKVYDWAESFGVVTSQDPDSPGADPFAIFDVDQPDDLWKAAVGSSAEAEDRPSSTASRAFYIAFTAYTNAFEDNTGLDYAHAKQCFLLLEKNPEGRAVTYKRAGIAVTQDGTLFSLQEAHGWTRQKITIV